MSEAVAIWRRVLGDDHPYLASSLSTLGAMYRNEGQLAEAEPLLRESVAIQRRAGKGRVPARRQSLQPGQAPAIRGKAAGGRARRAGRPRHHAPYASRRSPDVGGDHVGARLDPLRPGPVQWKPSRRSVRRWPSTSGVACGDWQRSQMKTSPQAALAGRKQYVEAERLLVDGYNGMKDNPSRRRTGSARLLNVWWTCIRLGPSPSPALRGPESLASWRRIAAPAK